MRAALALAALLAAANAHAAATATASVTNRSATTLTRADGSASIIDGNTATLRPGDSLSYSFDYALEVRDDGLAVSDATRGGFFGPFWSPQAITLSAQGGHGGIQVNSFEVAMASIYVSGRPNRPWESLSGPSIVLATKSDEIAEHQVLAGHGEVTFGLLAGFSIDEQVFTLPELHIDTVAMSDPTAVGGVIASVPEPQTWTLMLLGLASMAAFRRRQR